MKKSQRLDFLRKSILKEPLDLLIVCERVLDGNNEIAEVCGFWVLRFCFFLFLRKEFCIG